MFQPKLCECIFVDLDNKRVSNITINHTNMALCSEEQYCVLDRSVLVNNAISLLETH